MTRILICDDHKERREALKLLIGLEDDMVCIADLENCSNILEAITKYKPDVILMDIDMPGLNGIDAVKMVRSAHSEVLIIMQTVFEEDDKIFNSIRAGANGYFLKKTSPEKLIEGIRDVINGGAPMTASVAKRVLTFFQNRPANSSAETFNLSEREIGVLTLLVKGYSQKLIAAELNLSRFTVNNHLKKIYNKLHVHNASEAVSNAISKKIINL